MFLTYSLTLLFMYRCITYEQKSFREVGEGGGLLGKMFGVMFDIMFVHTYHSQDALFSLRILKRGNALVGSGDWWRAGGAPAQRF